MVLTGGGVVRERIAGGRIGGRVRGGNGGWRTLFVHGKLEIAYAAVGAEDFAEVAFVDVFG